MSFKSFYQEKSSPSVVKMMNRAVMQFRKEHKQALLSDYSIELLFTGPNTAEVRAYVNHFLADEADGHREFQFLIDELKHIGRMAEAIKSEVADSYFGGAAAGALIKRGKIIHADVLLSNVTVEYTFPQNFKR